ncbi:MAG: transposase, partial [Acidobacteriaceae bacterium]
MGDGFHCGRDGERPMEEVQRRKNRTKARVRSKAEWPFRILKRVFGFTKVRYCGLKKNHPWLLAAFALV